MRRPIFPCLLLAGFLAICGCAADALAEPVEMPCTEEVRTYETDIRPIIERTCAYSGCHLGGAPGVYNDYSGLVPQLESGSFRERVILQRDNPNLGMPPNYAPEGRALDLTPRELDLISCWLDAGYPRE